MQIHRLLAALVPFRGSASQRLLLFGLLTVQTTLLLYGVFHTGITADEPNHILGGHFFWVNSKSYPLVDLPPLLKLVSGRVPSLVGIEMPSASDPKLKGGREWDYAVQWSGDLKDPYFQKLAVAARLPVILFPVALSVLVWFWGRREWGAGAGLLGAAIVVFEPTVVGHGVLVKNDVASALAYAVFWFAAWRFWQTPDWRRVAWLSAATVLGVGAKLSLLILVGIAPALILLRAPRRAWLFLSLFGGIFYCGLCAMYLGNIERLDLQEVEAIYRHPNAPRLLPWAAHVFAWIPIPANFWAGCSNLVLTAGDAPPVYVWGHEFRGGVPWYFLAALAVKVPIGFQLLFLGAGSWSIRRMVRERDGRWLFLLIPPLLYLGLASMVPFQLGVRLVLPALPFAALLAAAAWVHWPRLVMVAAAAGAIEAMIYYPQGISFFNAWAGGPAGGLEYLADSNLDWGQGLPEVRHWMEREGVTQIRLTYFGMDTPWRYFRDEQIIWEPPPWNKELAAGRRELEPTPGVYAISASVLPGHYFGPEYRGYYRQFRNRRPTARVGYSIYIYDLR